MKKLTFTVSSIFVVLLIVGSIIISFQACDNEDIMSPTSHSNVSKTLSGTGTGCSEINAMETPIYAGQTILVGKLLVWNDLTNLYVKYSFNSGYTADWLHLWVGCDITGVPLGGNNPVPGQFPYKLELNGGSMHTFTIPLTAISGCGTNFGCPTNPANIFILAHAEVTGNVTETGWSFKGYTDCGKTFDEQWGKAKWGWITCYKFCCVPDIPPGPPPETYSETAFGKPSITQGGYVFVTDNKANPEVYPSWDLTRNRWGWGGEFNIATSTFPITFPVYAGCGLNKISNGTLVGNMTISKTATNVILTYTATPPYTFSEVHIYLSDLKPTTIAPGQYGNTYNYDPPVTNKTYTFPLPAGKFYFIGHSVAQLPVPTK